ncbi:MAG: fibronectin type III domain-containing protein [Verrucomicrobiae bacterium]|nr:fibronectin type III domain-containing protein [Verrucomicrobiae bacterium]
MRSKKPWAASRLIAAGAALFVAGSAFAGSVTYNFTTDPQADPNLEFGGNFVNTMPWVDSGGNPGGFLALTWPIGSLYQGVIFPDIDPGKIVTGFNFKCDIRTGNSTGDRVADGFSVSFARDGDPVLGDINNMGNFAGGIAEGGTTTGIAVLFDTWSGNTLPDGADIEGIIVRVDNRTVLRQALPTRHGACTDITSLQTGPWDSEYWAQGGDPMDPASWAGLCWQPFEIDLTQDGKLTVAWKGNKVLDAFQTDYFPSAGRIVFAGRTGGANGHTHIDNLQLTTVAVESGGPPTAPGALTVAQAGARRVALSWGPATTPDGTRVAYRLSRNGNQLGGLLTETTYEDRGLSPGTTYNYSVVAVNLAGQDGPAATVSATTVAEVAGIGFPLVRIYDGFGGAGQFDIDTVLADPKWPNSPDRTFYANGLNFADFGDNYMAAISTTITVPETGQYRFFVRSDDASRFYINPTGTAIPNPLVDLPVAQENGCCGPFEEPGAGENVDDGTFPTSEPIQLTAGSRYGVLFLVKEAGGGDFGQVAMRREGSTTPANQLTPIGGALIEAPADAVGASATIVTQPADATTVAYQPVTFSVTAETVSAYGAGTFYQWYKNDALIPNATAATYTIPVAMPADNGAKFKVLVGTLGANVTSAEATLTVNAGQAPLVANVEGSESFTAATVRFNQPVSAPSSTTVANYTFSGGLTVSAATVVDQYTVRLTTSTQAEGTTYNLTVNGVQNLGGTPAAAASGVLNSWLLVPNRARADQYTGFTGASQADMDTVLADAKWPNSPDVVRYTPGMTFGETTNFGDTWGDNHMVAMRAILRPTESGQYRFFVRSDDASRLYINTSGAAIPDPLVALPIAQENGCCGPFENPGAAQNADDGTFPTSEPINLTAGQSYGLLFLVKEGGGGDWGQVAWRREGDTTPAASLTALSAHVYWYGPPVVQEIAIDSIALQGGNVVITYATGTLQSAPAVTGPWTDVAGASSPYSTAPTGDGTYFRVRQ